ncbi:MAG: DUF4236 domain-containing protein [Pseudomonadota bacterium]
MGLRFQKRIPIFKGVTLNISKTGLSITLGQQGATINLGRKGATSNVGLPGSGLSWRESLKGASWAKYAFWILLVLIIFLWQISKK